MRSLKNHKELKDPPDLANQSLRKCFDDFVDYIQSEKRMTFWKYDKAERKYKWVLSPEKHAKNLLLSFLNGRFGDSISAFDEIKSGAGKIDIFIVFPSGEKTLVELKMCGHRYSKTYAQEGIEQLAHYMENKGTKIGYLIVFDSRVRDFSKGFRDIETINEMSLFVRIADVRPYVKQKDAPDGV